MTTRARALVVPDEQTWTMLGTDPAALGLEPTFALRRVERVLVPEVLPEPLAEALGACLAEVPAGTKVEERPLSLPRGEIVDPSREHAAHHDHAEHDAHHDHPEHHQEPVHDRSGGHEHGHEHHEHGHEQHDMMAIVGEPSSDGLVMESIDLRYGPLATPLPGGLAVDVTLDGDVVAEAVVHALLTASTDPLAPAASSAPPGWHGVVAVEVERAVSHLAWLRAFARLLGWSRLVDACTHAIAACGDPASALPALDTVAATVHESHWLRARTRARGILTAEEALAAGLRGPNARASGLPDEARIDDPRYRALGFQPVTHTDGDALARTLVRADEARAAIGLATAALGVDGESPPAARAESPRGGDGPGARRVAAEAMIGVEWATALVILASFDLSPWDVAA